MFCSNNINYIFLGCIRGKYGENCIRECPVNCLDDICNIFSGTCYLCDDGYKGPICDNGRCLLCSCYQWKTLWVKGIYHSSLEGYICFL